MSSARARHGHELRAPLVACPTTSPATPLFWVVTLNPKKSDVQRTAPAEVKTQRRSSPVCS